MESPIKYEIVIEADNCSASNADGSVVVLTNNKQQLADAIERLGWFEPSNKFTQGRNAK